MEPQEEFWLWLRARLDKKRAELQGTPDSAGWRHTLKTEISELEVITDSFAKAFGYPLGR